MVRATVARMVRYRRAAPLEIQAGHLEGSLEEAELEPRWRQWNVNWAKTVGFWAQGASGAYAGGQSVSVAPGGCLRVSSAPHCEVL